MTTDRVQRISGMIGFARRAGKTVIGTELVCRAMSKGEVKLVVISSTASDSTKKKLTVKSAFYGVCWVMAEIDTERLGALVGKGGAVAAIAITDRMFADEIVRLYLPEASAQ